jgi:hypothetical protein
VPWLANPPVKLSSRGPIEGAESSVKPVSAELLKFIEYHTLPAGCWL